MTLKERTNALSRVSIFAGLSRRSLEKIARTANEFEAPAGQVLIEPRTAGSGMFVLLEGTAMVDLRGSRSYDVNPGECFGELALLSSAGSRLARVRAKTPVRCLAIARNDFVSMLAAEPTLSLAILQNLAARLAAQQ